MPLLAMSCIHDELVVHLTRGSFPVSDQANPVKILQAMENESAPLKAALANGRPTVVDFYAAW